MDSSELKEKFSKLSVLVVGDICLDQDFIGGYSGYSREVEQLPIFRAEKVKYSPGGGGNLAVCFAALGVQTAVAGYWGNSHDINRQLLEKELKANGIMTMGMWYDGRTPVFIKYYFHNNQHVYRADLISEPVQQFKSEKLAEKVAGLASAFQFVACADYEEVNDFGVCSPEVIEAVRQNAKMKFATSRKHMDKFHGFDYLIQNERELGEASFMQYTDLSIKKQIVATKGGRGASVYENLEWNTVKSQELTENIDPCGCGDMFYAIYASSVMAGYDTTTCLQLANAGARCVARKLFGTGQADCEEITKEWEYLYGQV